MVSRGPLNVYTGFAVGPISPRAELDDLPTTVFSAFADFFGVEFALCAGSASDALVGASTVGKILALRLGRSAPRFDHTDWLFAVVSGGYGGGRGPYAHHAHYEFASGIAVGPVPALFEPTPPLHISEESAPTSRWKQQLTDFYRNQECCGVILEMVSPETGIPIHPLAYRTVLETSAAANKFVLVDETMTAIRCGAPFCYQRAEYAEVGFPDLVVFGKGLVACGVAVDPRGGMTSRVGPEDMQKVLGDARYTSTSFSAADVLLKLLATLGLAKKEDWCGNARATGELLRGILDAEGIRAGGLGALMYLRLSEHRGSSLGRTVMPAAVGRTGVVRWIPALDTVTREHIAGLTGPIRDAVAKREFERMRSLDLMSPSCFGCGTDLVGDLIDRKCDQCPAALCKECETFHSSLHFVVE